jgi:hypothetical protein
MKKESVDFLEYRGGYALVAEGELVSVINGYKDGTLKKDAIRVFAALKEKGALHAKSKVDVSRILNCKTECRGLKRLRLSAVRRGEAALGLVSEEGRERKKAVSRLALRAVAQGRLTCTEAVVLFMYSLKRISQRKALRRLLPKERYARFTYRELSELSGIPKANISRAVSSLKEKGFLGTVWVVKQNENQFGLLFVDGQNLSLIPGASADRSRPERKKTTTPQSQSNNAQRIETTTLKNSYPKTSTQESKASVISFVKGESDWERIQRRAKAMRENAIEQVA